MEQVSYLKSTLPLKLLYGLTLGFVACLFSWSAFHYYWGDFTVGFVPFFLNNLTILLFLCSVPLALSVAVFLTKGGGLNYFRSWNAGKKLHFSGLIVFAGYAWILLPMVPLDFFSSLRAPYEWGFNFFGLSLMSVGFGSLFVLYSKNVLSRDGSVVFRCKAKKFAMVFTVVVLAMSVLCLTAAYCKLQTRCDYLSESFEHFMAPCPNAINVEWTDNVGVDSNFVNCTGGVLNSGYHVAFNVTLIVSVVDSNYTLLETQEFSIGDLPGMQYKPFDVNFEYDGKLSKVYTSTSWD